jgi:hypothetical protein
MNKANPRVLLFVGVRVFALGCALRCRSFSELGNPILAQHRGHAHDTGVHTVTVRTSRTAHGNGDEFRTLSKVTFAVRFVVPFFGGTGLCSGMRSDGMRNLVFDGKLETMNFGRDYRNEVRLTPIQIVRNGDARTGKWVAETPKSHRGRKQIPYHSLTPDRWRRASP